AVVVASALLVTGGTIVARSIPPAYTAQATLLLTGAKYRLPLDPKFTTADPTPPTPATPAAQDPTVASRDEVARAARAALLAEAGDSQPVSVDVRAKGTLLTIVAYASDPEHAARSANAYAQAATQRFDAVYGVADQDQAALEKRLAE